MTVFRIITPILVAFLLFASVVDDAPGQTAAQLYLLLADTVADQVALNKELEALKDSLSLLGAKWTKAEGNRLYWAGQFKLVSTHLLAIVTEINEDESRFRILTGQIKQLKKDIKGYEAEINWINAWFTHNDPAYSPSLATRYEHPHNLLRQRPGNSPPP